MKTPIDFTKTESPTISKIINRAIAMYESRGVSVDWLDVRMDLAATHNHCYKLDLVKLLDFSDFDFFHDIHQINSNLNRATLEMENCFVPRSALPCSMGAKV